MDVAASQTGVFSLNGATATESPAGTFNLNNAIPVNSLFVAWYVPVRPGQRIKMKVTAALPAGATATSVRIVFGYRDAAGGFISGLSDPVTVALTLAAQTWEFDGGTVPAGTAVVRLYLQNTVTGNGLKIAVTALSLASTGTAEELIGASLERPYRRTNLDLLNTAEPQFTVGVPGLLAGQLTYLCATYPDVIALDAVYCTPAPAVVQGAAGPTNPLGGLRHRAIGTGRLAAERALPGKPSKWLFTVDVREVS